MAVTAPNRNSPPRRARGRVIGGVTGLGAGDSVSRAGATGFGSSATALRTASAASSIRLSGGHVVSAGSDTAAGPVSLAFPAAFERDCSDSSPKGAERGADASTRNCLPGPPPTSRSKAGDSGDEGLRAAWCNGGPWTEGFWLAIGWPETLRVFSTPRRRPPIFWSIASSVCLNRAKIGGPALLVPNAINPSRSAKAPRRAPMPSRSMARARPMAHAMASSSVPLTPAIVAVNEV